MPSLVAMAAFAQVVEAGSFTAAARDLGLSTPVVSKRIGELEHELGTRLLHRTTRKLSLTEAGSVFYQHCARLVEEAKTAEEAVARLNEAPRGLLRITAPVTFGSNQVAPAIPAFLARYPEVSLEMVLNDRLVDLAEEAFDLAIRLTATPQPNLVARRLISTSRVVCAAPDYWHRHGKPRTPAELTHHNCLLYASVPMRNEWVFHGPDGEERIQVRGNFWVNGPEALREAAVGGLGVIRLPSTTLNRDITAGHLETALDDYASPDTDIYAMYLPNRYLSKKTRVFIDFLTEWYAR
ncbi:MAG: LysR family transcriptional regulator [Gammaproteobacteria bacterium]|jgi:LysR family transcriptional activator of dmlA